MKIAIIGYYPSDEKFWTGVERVVYNLSHELSNSHNEIILFKKKRYRHFFRKQEIQKDKNLTIFNVSHLGLMVGLIKGKYDIINIHNLSLFFIIPFILIKLKIIYSKIIFVSHGLVDIEKKNESYNYPVTYFLYQRIALQWSDHIIAVSNYFKQSIIDIYKIEDNKISVIYNGIDKFFFIEKKTTSFMNLTQYILYVGEINKEKGLDFLLKAICKVNNVCLVLIGNYTPFLEELKIEFSELFKSKKVIYVGRADGEMLLSAYSNSKFLILTSRHDPFGLVVLEAMAAGKPVIISDKVGSKELIENGKEGFIISFGDVESLALVISFLLTDDSAVERMGKYARNKAMQNTWDIKAKQYVELFRNVIDGKFF